MKPPNKNIEPPVTLRDQFAMAALTGLLSASFTKDVSGWHQENDPLGSFSKRAYQYADAMLEERKRRR